MLSDGPVSGGFWSRAKGVIKVADLYMSWSMVLFEYACVRFSPVVNFNCLQ